MSHVRERFRMCSSGASHVMNYDRMNSMVKRAGRRGGRYIAILVALFSCSSIAGEHPSVFVAEFVDATGGRGWAGIATGIRELLVPALSDHDAVAVLERDDLDLVLQENALNLKWSTDAGAVKLGAILGADRIVTGSVLHTGAEMTLIAKVLDVKTGVIQAACKADGRVQDALDVTVDLAGQIAKALDLPFDPGTAARFDPTPIASFHCLRGLGFFHARNYNRAIMEFMQSADLQLKQSRLPYWIGKSYFLMGEPAHAQVELRRFLAAAPNANEAPEARDMLTQCTAQLEATPMTFQIRDTPRTQRESH
jgi:TolB-like protein